MGGGPGVAEEARSLRINKNKVSSGLKIAKNCDLPPVLGPQALHQTLRSLRPTVSPPRCCCYSQPPPRPPSSLIP